jgi:hypothetical protein
MSQALDTIIELGRLGQLQARLWLLNLQQFVAPRVDLLAAQPHALHGLVTMQVVAWSQYAIP